MNIEIYINVLLWNRLGQNHSGSRFNIKATFPLYDRMIKIRRSYDHLSLNLQWIPIQVRRHLYIETSPCSSHVKALNFDSPICREKNIANISWNVNKRINDPLSVEFTGYGRISYTNDQWFGVTILFYTDVYLPIKTTFYLQKRHVPKWYRIIPRAINSRIWIFEERLQRRVVCGL